LEINVLLNSIPIPSIPHLHLGCLDVGYLTRFQAFVKENGLLSILSSPIDFKRVFEACLPVSSRTFSEISDLKLDFFNRRDKMRPKPSLDMEGFSKAWE